MTEQVFFHITSPGGHVVLSNLPDHIESSSIELINKVVQGSCRHTGRDIRHGCYEVKGLLVYIVSYDKTITNKILKRYFDACKLFIEHFVQLEDAVKESGSQNFKRLKHNLVTHNTNIIQELERMFPVEQITGGAVAQLDFIKKQFFENSQDASRSILRVIKAANLMKSDIDVYDMLSSPTPFIEMDRHVIYKVLMIIVNPFWLELLQKDIKVDIQESREKALIDFKSMSVVFSHIFDNITKYIAPKTTLTIKFKSNPNTLDVIFEMTSLRIKPDELDKIFEENESGEYAKKIGKSGDGIGMHVAKRLLALNKGAIEIQPNFDKAAAITMLSIPFERNRLIISLQK